MANLTGPLVPASSHPLIRDHFIAKTTKASTRAVNFKWPPLHPEAIKSMDNISRFQLKKYRWQLLSVLTPDPATTYPFCAICGFAENCGALMVASYQVGQHPDYPNDPAYVGRVAKSFGNSRFYYYDYVLSAPHQYFLQCANCELLYRSSALNTKDRLPRPNSKKAIYSRRSLLEAISRIASHPDQLSAATLLEIKDIEAAYRPKHLPPTPPPTHKPSHVRISDIHRITPYLAPNDPLKLSQSAKDELLDSSNSATIETQ